MTRAEVHSSAQAEPRRRTPLERLFLVGAEGTTEVLLIRHAQQEIDPAGPIGDTRDPPLSEHGREQARLLGESLANTHLDALFMSTLRRAQETAQAVAGHHELEPQVIENLREMEIFRDVKDSETASQMFTRELLRALQARLVNEHSWGHYPYSEDGTVFRTRAINAVEQAIASQRGERIVIVCHGGVINAYVSHVLKSPYDLVFQPVHTSVNTVVVGEGRRVLWALNDAQHLHTPERDYSTV